LREFLNTSRAGKVRVWRIEVIGNQVLTEYGDLGGKMQQVSDTAQAKNVGRSNEVSAEDSAIQQMEREILLKRREGYRDLTDEERENKIDFVCLPQNLSFYKPDNTLSPVLLKKLEDGEVLLARKRDGEMMVIVISEGNTVDIYSRKMLRSHHLEEIPWTKRFPHIVKEIEDLELPANTILLGEMVSGLKDDDRWALASIMKSKTDEAIKIQQLNGWVFYYCWDIAFWAGEDWLSNDPVCKRYTKISELFEDSYALLPIQFSDIDQARDFASKELEEVPKNHREMAMALATHLGWEGWVVVDPHGVFGDKAYNFRGKTDRPGRFSGKLKPEFDADAILLWDPDSGVGLYGRGKHQGKVGSVQLYQYNSRGELIYLCDCGGGMDDEFRAKYSNPEAYPMVAEIRYTSRTFISEGDRTNALQFPRIRRVRTDKSAEECVEPNLDEEEK
jgi:hypothetical protein